MLTIRVAKHWNTLHREEVDAQSLETFKIWWTGPWATWLSCRGPCSLQGSGTRWPLKVSSNSNDSDSVHLSEMAIIEIKVRGDYYSDIAWPDPRSDSREEFWEEKKCTNRSQWEVESLKPCLADCETEKTLQLPSCSADANPQQKEDRNKSKWERNSL